MDIQIIHFMGSGSAAFVVFGNDLKGLHFIAVCSLTGDCFFNYTH